MLKIRRFESRKKGFLQGHSSPPSGVGKIKGFTALTLPEGQGSS